MSIIDGPRIVTSGLVLNLDAANIKSYPGSGTTWSDLSGNGVTGSLSNGPTFTNTNYGQLLFDGTNDFVSIGNTTSSISNNFTIEAWCRPNATHEIDSEANTGLGGTSGQRYLYWPYNVGLSGSTDAGAGISAGTNGVSVYEHSSSYIPPLLVSTTAISSTVSTLITVVYISKQPRLYLNGVLDKVGLTSPRPNVYPVIFNIAGGTYGYFSGNISVVKLYNRSLSADEVAQNYNAMRGRFGI